MIVRVIAFSLLSYLHLFICPAWSQILKVGYPSIGGSMTPLFVAKEAGAFARQNLAIEPIFIGGGNRVAQAMVAGELQFAQVSQAPVMAAVLGGADLVFIANLYPTMVYSVYANSDVKKIPDLKGRKVGITSFGSVIDFGTRLFLNRFRLAPERDVALIQVGGQTQAVAALAAHGIDAALLNPPASIEAQRIGAHEIYDLRQLGVDYAFVGLALSRAYWKRNPATVESFVKAYLEGISVAKKDPVFTMKVLEKYTKASDPKVLQETYRVFVTDALLEKPYTTEQGIQLNLDGLKERIKKAGAVSPRDFYDNSVIEKLDKAGYLQSLSGQKK
jgi:NitT/TauT family transport system substrate-binding protein